MWLGEEDICGVKGDRENLMKRDKKRQVKVKKKLYKLGILLLGAIVIQLLGDNQTIWAWVIKLGIIAAMVFLVKDLIVISDEKDREGE